MDLSDKAHLIELHDCSAAVAEKVQLAVDDGDGPAFVQWLAAATTNLAHDDEEQHRKEDSDGEEYRAEDGRRNARNKSNGTEAADNEGQHAEHKCQYGQRAGAAVEDQNPAAVVCDDQSARVGQYSGLG